MMIRPVVIRHRSGLSLVRRRPIIVCLRMSHPFVLYVSIILVHVIRILLILISILYFHFPRRSFMILLLSYYDVSSFYLYY